MLDIMNLKKLIVEEYRREKAKGTKIPKFAEKLCQDITEEMENQIVPTKPFIYVNKKKGIVAYKNENGKEFKAVCMKGDKFDLYVGASFALGYANYGSKTQYNKVLGVNGGENMGIASLVNAYTRFGGKKEFEEYVNEINVTKEKVVAKKENVVATTE